MARSVTTIEGFSELEAKLKALPENVAKRGAMNAMRRAAGLMRDAIEERTPVATGNLQGSIKIKARARSLAGLAEYAGVMSAGGDYREARQALRSARRADAGTSGARITVEVGAYAPHAHLVEFGTVERFQKKSGKSTGTMPMDPFMRPAFDATAASCALAIKTELTREIARIEGKLTMRASEAGLFDG